MHHCDVIEHRDCNEFSLNRPREIREIFGLGASVVMVRPVCLRRLGIFVYCTDMVVRSRARTIVVGQRGTGCLIEFAPGDGKGFEAPSTNTLIPNRDLSLFLTAYHKPSLGKCYLYSLSRVRQLGASQVKLSVLQSSKALVHSDRMFRASAALSSMQACVLGILKESSGCLPSGS